MRFSILLAIDLLIVAEPAAAFARRAKLKPKAQAPVVAPAPPAIPLIDTQKAEAKALTQQANQDYTLGRFTDALDKYSRAYEKFHAPELLFNIGQCHKNLRQRERAIFFFQGYLRARPDAQNAKQVEDMITDLQAEQAREEAEARENERLERERLLAASSRPSTMPGLMADNPLITQPVYKKAWFWGTLGGAVAVVAVATTIAVVFATQPKPARSTTQGDVILQ